MGQGLRLPSGGQGHLPVGLSLDKRAPSDNIQTETCSQARFHAPLRAGPADPLKAELNQRVLLKSVQDVAPFPVLTGEALEVQFLSFFFSPPPLFFIAVLKRSLAV